jgi:hypothetical protein
MNSGQISEMLTITSFSYQPGLFLTVYSFRRLAADSAVEKGIESNWAHFARTSVDIVNKHYATNTRYDSHELVKDVLNESFGTTSVLGQIQKDFQEQANQLEEEIPIREILFVCYLDYNQPLFLTLLKNNTLKFFNNASIASKNVNLFRRFLFVKKGFRSLPISSFINEKKIKKNGQNEIIEIDQINGNGKDEIDQINENEKDEIGQINENEKDEIDQINGNEKDGNENLKLFSIGKNKIIK